VIKAVIPSPSKATVAGSKLQVVVHARLLCNHYFQGLGSLNKDKDKITRAWQNPSIAEEPLFSRAWAFQERILARRTLDYHANEIVWECREMRKCECTESDRRELDTQKKRFTDAMSVGGRNRDDVWMQIIETYTTLALTFSSDKLPALSGLAQRMAASKRSRYLAGMWEEDMPHCLLWYPSPEGRESEYDSTNSSRPFSKPARQKDAPSWSWVSMECPAVFRLLYSWKNNVPVAKVMNAECNPAGVNPYGHCLDGRLTIRGPVVNGQLKYNRKLDQPFWISAGNFWFHVWPDFDYSEPGTSYFLESGTKVFLMEMIRNADQSHGLILRIIHGSDGSETYERLGSFMREGVHGKLVLQQIETLESKTESKIVFNDVFADAEIKTLVIV